MFKILLTGANGFIGSNILRKLSHKNEIFVLIRKEFKYKKLINKNIKFVKFNDYEKLNKKLKKLNIDVVIHCATHYVKDHTFDDIKKLINSNILLGNIILENLKHMKVKKFINFSTVWQDPYPKKDVFKNLYAVYKNNFSKIIKYYERFYSNVKFFEIVLSDTFGFGDERNKLINKLKKNYKLNKSTKIVSKNLFINLINVDDIVNGLMIIMYKTIKPGQYVIKKTKDLKIFNLIKIFNKSNKKKIYIKWLSEKVIKNPNIKYNQLKDWSPKKSNLKDIINYIKN